MRVGVFGDTHGGWDARLEHPFLGVALIRHAGDIGDPWILTGFQRPAPTRAVRGNVDRRASGVRPTTHGVLTLAGWRVRVLRLLGTPARSTPRAARRIRRTRPALVVSGHRHVAHWESRAGIACLSPGSAGPSCFGRPRRVALLDVSPQRDHRHLIRIRLRNRVLKKSC